MKTFMTPDAPYTSAARTCRTHNRVFMVYLVPTDRKRMAESIRSPVVSGNGKPFVSG
jgi:hypothetical protein